MKLLGLAALLALAGCSAGEEAADTAPTALVTLAPAQAGAVDEDLTLYGAVENGAFGRHVLAAPAEATIVSIDAPLGSTVVRGQVVARLSASPTTRLDLAKAQTDAQAANLAFARAQRLRADGLVSDADVETARGALATAAATRNNLGIRGGFAVLRAPGAGTVQGLTAKPGDQLAAGTTIATIGASGDVRARFGVDPAVAQRIRPGQAIQIEMIDGSHAATVSVVGVDPQIDPATRLASVYARVPGNGLGAGEPLRASLSVGASSTGVSIPYAALLDDGGRSYVFVVRNGVAKSVDVSPGNSSGDRVQILKGLNPGDRVVTEGGTALEDGMKVSETAPGAKK